MAIGGKAHQPSVRAEQGIRIRGNVFISNIAIGPLPEHAEVINQRDGEIRELQKKRTAQLESELLLNQRKISAILEVLGEKNVPRECLHTELLDKVKCLEALRAEMSARK